MGLSEPEAKAQVDFVLGHPNINGVITYHTHSGMILRPYAHRADDAALYKDRPYFDGIGKMGRTSIEPIRAPGMRSAMPIASSRSLASTR
jgi:hypothetical protein